MKTIMITSKFSAAIPFPTKANPISRIIGVCIFFSLPFSVQAADPAAPKPEEGKDWVELSAIGEGLCVNNLFQSNMVIQRDKTVRVWGWALPGEKVTVSFAGQSHSVKAEKDRHWQVELTAVEANATPQTMTVKGEGKTLTFTNILVGDVWILGGQSNMERSLGAIEGGKVEAASANFSEIRHMTMVRKGKQEYKKSFPLTRKWDQRSKSHIRGAGYWETCSPETVRELSAIGYVFARRIHMASNVPIGVIDTSVGGSTLESWTPYAAVKSVEGAETRQWVADLEKYLTEYTSKRDLEERRAKKKAWIDMRTKMGKTPRPVNQILPTDLRPANIPAGNLYGGMIAPLAGFSAKGIIWHQGYNNCFDGSLGATRYYQIFPKMIESWRAAFNDPKLAFGIISLCTADDQNADNYLEKMLDVGAYIREAQYKTFLDLRKAGDGNIGFASSYDQRRSNYHPSLKIPVGERIATWAMATQYDLGVRWEPPYLKEMKVEDGSILLSFEVKGPLGTNPEGPIVGFAIAGEDGKFQPAHAEFPITSRDKNGKVRRNTGQVVLTSPLIPKPIHYRYAWARNPHASLVSAWNKLPIGTQRSDSWTLPDMYKSYTGKESVSTTGKLERREVGELKKALIATDLERRVHEAKVFLKQHASSP
ncbi:MAG: sialate O-acetylesterase [Cryomorphaceae bacterium]|jgi:sialate O-acetylesterase